VQITLEQIAAHDSDLLLAPDEEFADEYQARVARGRGIAANKRAAFVAICRNAMPFLPRTLKLVEKTAAMFQSSRVFIYENDSIDGTKQALHAWADGAGKQVCLNTNNRPHLNSVVTQERTIALAEYRAECQAWVRRTCPHVDYVVVFDTDPWGGWSVDGVANGVSWLEDDKSLSGLASYSWAEVSQPAGNLAIHYDAFAARLNHWKRGDQNWFHVWHPVVGSPPVRFRSAFGQLAIYRAADYLAGRYSGEDCEHVCFHKTLRGGMALNPSQRCVSFWVPYGGQHGNH